MNRVPLIKQESQRKSVTGKVHPGNRWRELLPLAASARTLLPQVSQLSPTLVQKSLSTMGLSGQNFPSKDTHIHD